MAADSAAPKVELTRRYRLEALHMLRGDRFSDQKNREVFGPCSRLHGHEYQIEVTVSARLSRAGWVISRDRLDGLVQEILLDPLNGTNLSDHFRFTTGEALAVEFYELLRQPLLPEVELKRIRVRETAKNSFIFGGMPTAGSAP